MWKQMNFSVVRLGHWRHFSLFFLATLCVWMYRNVYFRNFNDHSFTEEQINWFDVFPLQSNTSFEQYQLNVAQSNLIPLDRDIQDTRASDCLLKQYDINTLPRVSIVMPFYDESWSMLLRAVHSILNRSPPNLITEIILVDDYSNYVYLKQTLSTYISRYSVIRILRNKKREGLIRSRMIGARNASAEVLIFLDAHVECNEGWLQPLLETVQRNKSTIAIPHIDTINPQTIKYSDWKAEMHGTFMWNMDFSWRDLPEDMARKRTAGLDPIATPTMIGCAMAVQRRYFFHIGGFDEGMYIWGGENLELSFRTWMCHGSMVIVPCSRVGHVFRTWLPFDFPDKYGGYNVISKNYQRVADMWMGEYNRFYYATQGFRIEYTNDEKKSLHTRELLKEKLKCQSFSWYLVHVTPYLVVPMDEAIYHGQIQNVDNLLCFDTNVNNELFFSTCTRVLRSQTFSLLSNTSLITIYEKCLKTKSDIVYLDICSNFTEAAKWIFNTTVPKPLQNTLISRDQISTHIGRFENIDNGRRGCLTQIKHGSEWKIQVLPCTESRDGFDKTQYFFITYILNINIRY